jgi:pyruvate dehydrogenase E2 component (dihydrolipoamide acetyltransferase)
MATDVLVPPLGQTVDTVTLVAWYKEEGEAVAAGEMLFAIETDKATLDIEAPASGVLQRVSARPGDQVQVLSAIAAIAAADERADAPRPAGQKVGAAAPAPQARPSAAGAATAETQPADRGPRTFISPRASRLAVAQGVPLGELRATGPEGAIVERDVRAYLAAQPEAAISPVARRVAEAAGVDWRQVAGSGPGGRVMRQDVQRAIDTAEVTEGEVAETIPVQSIRAVIAERMLQSAVSTARVTLTAEADATALVTLRGELNEDGVGVSYNDLLLYILGRALRDHPRLNASMVGDTIQVWQRIHVGLAVDTDRGLLVPVVRDVDRKGLAELAEETRALAQRAQAGQSSPEELRGGTFTLTNLGMYGIDAFTPLINMPESAILGVGRIKKQPAIVGDQVVARHMVWLSLSFDHRLVDGAPAARFLQRVVQLVERPHLMMA